MSFQKGIHYPHPPRGPGRKPYRMSDEALRARRRNLSKSRRRSDRESRTMKLWVWQACFDSGPRPSQRTLARQLDVYPSYVCKVQRKALSEGLDALVRHGQRVTAADLEEARHFTALLREQEPGLLAPAPQPRASDEPRYTTADDTQREAQETIRQAHKATPWDGKRRTMQEWQEHERRGGRRVMFSVRIPR